MSDDVDIGDNHTLRYFCWEPDRTIESNARLYEGVRDVAKAGASILHPNTKTGEPCRGAIWFDTPETRAIPGLQNAHFWQVHSWDPLTLSPSILCQCGDHGFIRGGKWVRA